MTIANKPVRCACEMTKCAVCNTTEDVGMFGDDIPVCFQCYQNGKLKEWLKTTMRKAFGDAKTISDLRFLVPFKDTEP